MHQEEPDYEQQYADREEERRYFPTVEQLDDQYIRFMAGENR